MYQNTYISNADGVIRTPNKHLKEFIVISAIAATTAIMIINTEWNKEVN